MPIGIEKLDTAVYKTLNLLPDAALLANASFEVQWMNDAAEKLLDLVAPYYGLPSSKEMLGHSMDFFHRKPSHNQTIMHALTDMHRMRITLAESIHTDIIILPVKFDAAEPHYLVMLADVTTKAEEDENQQRLIRQLSTPIMKVWDNAMALPLIGSFDWQRFDRMVIAVLEECAKNRYEYVILDVSKIDVSGDQQSYSFFQKLADSLRLIGAQCVLVGVTPRLAMEITTLERSLLIFGSTYDGIRYISEQK